MKDEHLSEEYPVIKKMYDLTVEFTLRVRDFPRDTRFILGDRVLTNCYAILEGLIEARYTPKRGNILRVLNIKLEKLRFQTRLCKDLKIISVKQYGKLCELLDEVGRMIGGWIKSLHQP
jgi:four helix bundle protein